MRIPSFKASVVTAAAAASVALVLGFGGAAEARPYGHHGWRGHGHHYGWRHAPRVRHYGWGHGRHYGWSHGRHYGWGNHGPRRHYY